MSLTKATFSMIEDAPINCKDYGAVGDGVADDTAAIQLALSAGNSSDRPVYLPPGTYKISSTLAPQAGVKFYGDGGRLTGAGRKTLITTANALNPMIDISNLKWGYFGGINLDGANTAVNGVGGINVFGAVVENVRSEQMTANGFRLTNDNTGLGCFSNSFIRCTASDNGDAGFLLDHFASNINDIVFDDCQALSCQYGIRESGLQQGRNITIQNCDIENCSDYGVVVTSKGFVITGTYFEFNGTSIFVDNSNIVAQQGGIISGCTILSTFGGTDVGINVNASYYTTIDSCWITECATGISVAGSSLYTQIRNCFFGDNTTNVSDSGGGTLQTRGSQIAKRVRISANNIVLTPSFGNLIFCDIGNNARTVTLDAAQYENGEGHQIVVVMSTGGTGTLTISDSGGATFFGQLGATKQNGSASLVLGLGQVVEVRKVGTSWYVFSTQAA
jgi:hypothetical protein